MAVARTRVRRARRGRGQCWSSARVPQRPSSRSSRACRAVRAAGSRSLPTLPGPHLRRRGRRWRGRTRTARGCAGRARRSARSHTLQRVDPQQLAELHGHALRAVLRITGGASVAHPDVEEAVRVELQLAAVVVRVRLAHEQQLAGTRLPRPCRYANETRRPVCRRACRCSRRRSGGCGRIRDERRPTTGPARLRSRPGHGCRGTCRQFFHSRDSGSAPPVRPRRGAAAPPCSRRAR